MEIGGIETSLIHLLNTIDTTQYDVDLFILSHKGELMQYIPKNINILPESPVYNQLNEPIASLVKKGKFLVPLLRLWAKLKCAIYTKVHHLTDSTAIYHYVSETVLPVLPQINQSVTYDLAISFNIPHLLVLNKVNAKKKIAWIHTDYSKVQLHVEKELPVWGGYDYIASISDDVTKAFLKTFPSLKDKIVVIENILSKELVTQRAKEKTVSFPKTDGRINILSIGRYSYPKNFDSIPDICRRIRSEGYNIYWHIIGYGGDEALIKQKIAEAGMQDYVILLGKQENPYPYIQACDLYIQPSRYEGKSVTVREAQTLGKPVIITNYPTAASQITDGVDGFIVPLENEACAEGIATLLKDNDKIESLKHNLQSLDFSNKSFINNLYQLIDK